MSPPSHGLKTFQRGNLLYHTSWVANSKWIHMAVLDNVGNANAFNEIPQIHFAYTQLKQQCTFSLNGNIYISQATDFQCSIPNILNATDNLRVWFLISTWHSLSQL